MNNDVNLSEWWQDYKRRFAKVIDKTKEKKENN